MSAKRILVCLLCAGVCWADSAPGNDSYLGLLNAHTGVFGFYTGKFPNRGDILVGEANADKARGDDEAAIDKWRAAIQAYASGHASKSDRVKQSATWDLLGYAYLDRNDFDQARAAFQASLKVAQALQLKREECVCRIGLAALAQALGDFPGAEACEQEALAAAADPLSQALAGISMGDYQLRVRAFAPALATYQAALVQLETAKVPQGIQAAWGGIGSAQAGLGRLPEAEEAFRSCLAVARELNDLPGCVDALNQLAGCQQAQGRDQEARRRYTEALSLMAVLDLDLPRQKSLAEYRLGALAAKAGDPAGAARRYLEAIETIEGTRQRIGSGTERVGYFADKTSVYEDLIDLLLGMSPETFQSLGPAWRSLGGNAAEAALTVAESTRGRTFLDQLSRSRLDLGADRVPSAVLIEEQRLIRALDQPPPSGSKVPLKLFRRQAQQAFADFLAQVRVEHPDYADIHYPQPTPPDRIPLRAGETLLVFKVNPSASYLWVLRPGRAAEVFKLPVDRARLTAQVRAFREPLERLDTLGAFSPALGQDLRRLLLDRALTGVAPADHLIIVPDGPLSVLPFEALALDGGAGYLGDQRRISYYASASILAAARRGGSRPALPRSLFALGDPVYDDLDPRYRAFLAGRPAEPGSAAPEPGPHLRDLVGATGAIPRLAETRGEVLSIGGQFGYPADSPHLKLDMNATKAELLRAPLAEYRYLHFATHGILDGDVPYIMEPALVLTQPGQPRLEDGFLRISDVVKLKIPADLVVLSACSTGMGRQVAGEGIQGLGRAFMMAGAKSVLVSLWSVESQSTALLMQNFYSNLQKGHSLGEALALARQALRQGAYVPEEARGLSVKGQAGSQPLDGSHPFFWAPFVLYGEWN